jgi:hypothetical protein
VSLASSRSPWGFVLSLNTGSVKRSSRARRGCCPGERRGERRREVLRERERKRGSSFPADVAMSLEVIVVLPNTFDTSSS